MSPRSSSGVVYEGLRPGRVPAGTAAWSIDAEPVPHLELNELLECGNGGVQCFFVAERVSVVTSDRSVDYLNTMSTSRTTRMVNAIEAPSVTQTTARFVGDDCCSDRH
jgi:hypothetical protein